MYEFNEDGSVQRFSDFTIGADPECFILDAKGQPVPALGLVPGTKAEPYKVPGGALQVDGVAAEVNIDPATSFAEFQNNLFRVIKDLQGRLPKDHRLAWVPHVAFDEKTWGEVPDEAKLLGCDPDFDAWSKRANAPPEIPTRLDRTRTAAGHIHIGWGSGLLGTDGHVDNCCDLVRQLDWYVGLPFTSSSDATRRLLYGRAGACRIKDYGVEYRVPSATWVGGAIPWVRVWNAVQLAIYQMSRGYAPLRWKRANGRVREQINTGEVSHAFLEDYSQPGFTLFNEDDA